ncbi:MAG: DnaJ domain-containing protein [Myxococcales bacterium]|nr:DnaJ domain-containing protein [Myxococcales bacterium]MCB9734510.1 DnaJ domain-containing protein [Deltaproteobacteria bacterium]
MSGIPDHYATLGVPRDADDGAIKHAYKLLAARYHPDRDRSAESAGRFRAVLEAYTVVGDPARRAAYDAGLGDGTVPYERGSAVAEAVGGILDRLFGVRDRTARPGRNRRYRLPVSFADAMRGTPQTLAVPVDHPCDACGGRGFPMETVPELCARCHGGGTIAGRPFLRAVHAACPDCDGRGYVFATPCPDCAGRGVVARTQHFEVPLAPGTADGARLRVRGAGEPGRFGGADGDLMVEVSVTPHRHLRRAGQDIVLTRPLPVTVALVGGRVSVPTIDGQRDIKVPPGSGDGTVLRMAGYGVPGEDGARGDQLVTLALELPDALDDAARAELERALAAAALTFPASRRFEEQIDES